MKWNQDSHPSCGDSSCRPVHFLHGLPTISQAWSGMRQNTHAHHDLEYCDYVLPQTKTTMLIFKSIWNSSNYLKHISDASHDVMIHAHCLSSAHRATSTSTSEPSDDSSENSSWRWQREYLCSDQTDNSGELDIKNDYFEFIQSYNT